MDKFLVTCNIPRLNHEDIEEWSRPIISKEIESQFRCEVLPVFLDTFLAKVSQLPKVV